MVIYPVVLFALLAVLSFIVLARALKPPLRLGPDRIYGGVSGLGGYFHPGQPTKLRSILMIVLAAALMFGNSLDGDFSQYLALQSEVSWIQEVVGSRAHLPTEEPSQTLGFMLLDPLFLDRFPGLAERAGENSAALSDVSHFSVLSINRLLRLYLFVLLVSVVLVLIQSSLAAAHAGGAHFALSGLYVAVISVVFFAIIFTLLQAGLSLEIS